METSKKLPPQGIIWGIWIIVLAIQCTDIKISIIKISEIFFLIYAIFKIRKIHKTTYFFISYFTIFLLITFIHNIFLNFDYTVATNFLKRPYWGSIGRFLEIISCLSFIEFTRNIIKKYGLNYTIDKTLQANHYFLIFILILYIIEQLGLSILNISCDNARLKAFYVEGGPFGLMCATFTLLSIYRKRPKFETIVLLLCTILAQSKAGISCICAYVAINTILKIYSKKKYRKYLFIACIIIIPLFIYTFMHIADMYISAIKNTDILEHYVNTNPNDYSSTAGRIPATFILYEMFCKHPIIGIGLGNYPVLRNLDEYRSFFPKIPIYDATGYGGFIDIVNQFGLIGITIWILFLIKLFKKGATKIYIILFCLPLIFGVQYTFLYPWFMIAINIQTNQIKKICTSPSTAACGEKNMEE